jgi:phosphoglycerol transferase MdoB-like AlkP superfamily enzyme
MRTDDKQGNLIERDMKYISIVLAGIIVVCAIGILLGMVIDPFLNKSGDHPGLTIGIQIALAGFIIGMMPILIFLLMLFLDTWKIEATPELREKYGISIKWSILFFFLIGIVTPMWLLLLIGYFAYQRRYNKYVAQRFTRG